MTWKEILKSDADESEKLIDEHKREYQETRKKFRELHQGTNLSNQDNAEKYAEIAQLLLQAKKMIGSKRFDFWINTTNEEIINLQGED